MENNEPESGAIILSYEQILQKIRRIAYQIHEHNVDAKEIVLVGIANVGYNVAKILKADLEQIVRKEVILVRLVVDKRAQELPDITSDYPLADFAGKTIILVDDVLNTGRTLYYACSAFLHIPLTTLQVAVIVDRSHKEFPVAPDYVGHHLSTTINEHIQVILSGEGTPGVYLK